MPIVHSIALAIVLTIVLAPFIATLYYSLYLVLVPMFIMKISCRKNNLAFVYNPNTGEFAMWREGSKKYVRTRVTIRQMLLDHTTLRDLVSGGYKKIQMLEESSHDDTV